MRVFSQHGEVIDNGLQVCDLSQHGDLHVLQGEKQDGLEFKQLEQSEEHTSVHISAVGLSVAHHHRLQHVDECTVTPSLLQEGSAHRLLLRLLHQQVQVADVLHGAVQLGAQVPPAWRVEGWRRWSGSDVKEGKRAQCREEGGSKKHGETIRRRS